MPRLHWPDLVNARDLGGTGGLVRERALIRTDNHDRFAADGLRALDAYGVSRVIDLRWRWETEKYPSPLATDERYRSIPASIDADTEPDSYRRMLDSSRPQLAEVLGAIAEAPPGAVVVHCHAGRDRTGVVVALALHAAGVAPEAIIADYALSDDNCPPTTMINTLDHLQRTYGGITGYLTGSGVTAQQLDAIRLRLT